PLAYTCGASTGIRSLDKNEAQLEGIILLIRRQSLPTVFSLVFRHKPELAARPQIHISRDAAQFISALISRGIEPVAPDSRVCEVVYQRYRGFGVRAETGESTSGSDVVPTALYAPEQRQPFRNRVARVERDAVEIISERSIRLDRSIQSGKGETYIAVVINQCDASAVEMEDAVHHYLKVDSFVFEEWRGARKRLLPAEWFGIAIVVMKPHARYQERPDRRPPLVVTQCYSVLMEAPWREDRRLVKVRGVLLEIG